MSTTAIDTGRTCARDGCPNPVVATTRTQTTKLHCSDSCRYASWKARKQDELQALIRQLAGRGLGV